MQTLFLVGPTATGKSAVAVELARRLDAEIVSADSMQVYRGMDIGTAKLSPAERRGVPHHLIDVVDVTEQFDVARYRRLALAAMADIRNRGKVAMVVGGSGLYVRSLTRGLDKMPGADAALRAKLEARPLEKLVAELEERDPLAASKLDLRNKRRVVRALEVLELTGQSIVVQQWTWSEMTHRQKDGIEKQHEKRASAHPYPLARSSIRPFLFLGLTRRRDDLYRRCDRRVDEMFARGLVNEVCRLLTLGLAQNRTAMQAVGYKEVAAHLRGETSLTECVAAVKLATRHLAKRQLTWFRREPNLMWVEAGETETVEETAQRIWEIIKKFLEETL